MPIQTGFLGNYLSKRQVGRVLAKSLPKGVVYRNQLLHAET